MSYSLDFARENGWLALLERSANGVWFRIRDRGYASKLRAPSFRLGRSPRLLGLSHMRIGEGFNAADSLWMEAVTDFAGERFDPLLTIGCRAHLSDRIHIACLDRITIGDHFLCGSGVLISDHTHGRYRGENQSDPDSPAPGRALFSAGPITIGNNVWLGDGVAVLPGAVIGDGAIIGAHAVVTGPVPAGTLAMGQPARPVREWNATTRRWEPIRREQT